MFRKAQDRDLKLPQGCEVLEALSENLVVDFMETIGFYKYILGVGRGFLYPDGKSS